MSLPNLSVPHYTVELPLSGKTIKYRPFIVAEEKILLMALESKNPKEILDAIFQIIEACTFGDIKKDSDVPAVDITYLFIQMRKRSKGEIADTAMRCLNTLDDGSTCNTINKVSIDLNKIELVNADNKMIVVPINDQHQLVIKPPTVKKMEVLQIMANEDLSVDDGLYALALMIDSLVDEQTVYNFADYSKEELVEFMYSLPADVVQEIRAAFDQMPKWVYRTEFKCRKCGHQEEVVLEDLTHFFL